MAHTRRQESTESNMFHLPFQTHPTALAVALAMLLGASPAASVVQIGIDWTSYTDDYNYYAATCDEATSGGTCGTNPGAIPPTPSQQNSRGDGQAGTIYSWGGLDGPSNSYYTWYNDLGYAFQVTGVRLQADGPVGTPPYNPDDPDPQLDANHQNQPQGTGAIAAWELAPEIRNTLIADMRLAIRNYGEAGQYDWDLSGYTGDTIPYIVYNNQLVVAQPDPPGGSPDGLLSGGMGWLDNSGPSPVTYQTPIDRTFVETNPGTVTENTIEKGGAVRVRLYEQAVNAIQDFPDAVLSDVHITIYGNSADLQGTGIDFGDVRVGTTTAADPEVGIASVTNTLSDGGFRALGVEMAEASGPFSGGGADTYTAELAAGATIEDEFGFNPTVISTATLSETIAVTSDDAIGTSFDLIGRGVGPQINAAYDGTDYTNGEIDSLVINFGTQDIDSGPTTPAEILTLTNIFGLDLDALTDLTVQLSWDDGFRLYYDGSELTSGYILSDPIAVISADEGLTSAAFGIRFDPSAVGGYTGSLMISTDQGGAFGVAGLGSSVYTVDLLGVGTQGDLPAPVPGTLTLLGIGLAGLRLRRR